MSVEVAHTADLGERSLSAARHLLDEVFSGELTDDEPGTLLRSGRDTDTVEAGAWPLP